MVLTLVITVAFQTSARLSNAYVRLVRTIVSLLNISAQLTFSSRALHHGRAGIGSGA